MALKETRERADKPLIETTASSGSQIHGTAAGNTSSSSGGGQKPAPMTREITIEWVRTCIDGDDGPKRHEILLVDLSTDDVLRQKGA